MAVVDITRVQQRVVAILNAAPPPGATFSATVSGKQGRYRSTEEIQYAILEVDNAFCRDLIITGHPYRSQFMVVTDPLTTNSLIPAHIGGQGMIEVSDDDSVSDSAVWLPALTPKSQDDITTVLAFPTNYGLTVADSKGWAWISDNRVVTTSPYCRIRYPQFTPNYTTCQADASLEDGEVSGAVAELFKDGSDGGLFDRHRQLYADTRAEIRAGAEVFPSLQMAERQVA